MSSFGPFWLRFGVRIRVSVRVRGWVEVGTKKKQKRFKPVFGNPAGLTSCSSSRFFEEQNRGFSSLFIPVNLKPDKTGKPVKTGRTGHIFNDFRQSKTITTTYTAAVAGLVLLIIVKHLDYRTCVPGTLVS